MASKVLRFRKLIQVNTFAAGREAHPTEIGRLLPNHQRQVEHLNTEGL